MVVRPQITDRLFRMLAATHDKSGMRVESDQVWVLTTILLTDTLTIWKELFDSSPTSLSCEHPETTNEACEGILAR